MLQLDLKGNKPIYEQIVEQMKYHVIKGHLQPYEAIPSVRKLALELKITPGTVARAYQELEQAHVIETIRGKGTFIAAKPQLKPDKDKLEGIQKQLAGCILEMKMMGMENGKILQMVSQLCGDLESGSGMEENHD